MGKINREREMIEGETKRTRTRDEQSVSSKKLYSIIAGKSLNPKSSLILSSCRKATVVTEVNRKKEASSTTITTAPKPAGSTDLGPEMNQGRPR